MKILPCMIVKNEEKIIVRCLSSILSIIESSIAGICICDTGSTDSTIDTIKEYLSALGKVKYKILQREWKDFGYNRSESFTETKKFAEELSLDLDECYALFIDADMLLKLSSTESVLKYNLDRMHDDAYDLTYVNNDISYKKISLAKLSKNWISVGKTHEYWTIDSGRYMSIFFPCLTLVEVNDGSSRPEKFDRDLKLLLESDDPRSKFYTAQTYKDMKNYAQAIKYYKERTTMEGWEEEIWYSYFQIARCMAKMDGQYTYDEVRNAYLDAFNFRPTRAETLFYLTLYAVTKNKMSEAFMYINVAREIPFPHKDVLFVEYKLYDYAISAYYIEVANVYLELLKNSYTSISTRKDKKKADEVRSTIVYLSKEIVFRNDIVGDLKKDIVNTINKRSCDLLDAYNIKAFEIPKPEEILFSHMIKIKEGFVLLVQRPNIIVIYNVNEELDKLKNLSALRIKASSCMKPTLFIDEELMISYYDPDTSSTRIVNMNGKEVKVINGKGIIYSSVNGPSIIMEDLSLVGKFDSLGKIKSSYDISNLTIAFGPILTKETETWFCKLNDDSYVLVLMKNSEIILISDPFRLGTMSSASSISITKDGSSTITQLDKILIVDVKYFIKLIEMTN